MVMTVPMMMVVMVTRVMTVVTAMPGVGLRRNHNQSSKYQRQYRKFPHNGSLVPAIW